MDEGTGRRGRRDFHAETGRELTLYVAPDQNELAVVIEEGQRGHQIPGLRIGEDHIAMQAK